MIGFSICSNEISTSNILPKNKSNKIRLFKHMFERGVPLCIWIKGNNIALQLFNKENGLDAILDRSLSLDENINRVLDKLKGFRSQMYKENPELIIGVLFDHPDRIPTRLTKLQFYTK